MGIRKIAKVAPSNADPNKNIATIAKECNATLLVDGKPYVEGTAISRDAVISLSMTYSYKDEDGEKTDKKTTQMAGTIRLKTLMPPN